MKNYTTDLKNYTTDFRKIILPIFPPFESFCVRIQQAGVTTGDGRSDSQDSPFIETVLSIPRISSLGMPRTLSRPDEPVRDLLFSENPTDKHFPFPLQVRNKFVHLLTERVNICPNSVGQVCPLRQGCPLKPSATPESKGPAAFAALTFLSAPTKGKPFGIPPEMRKNPGTQPRIFPFLARKTPTT